MLVCSEPFLNVALCKRARRDPAATRPSAEPVESRFGQAEAKWLRHVANCSACRYDERGSSPRACSPSGGARKRGISRLVVIIYLIERRTRDSHNPPARGTPGRSRRPSRTFRAEAGATCSRNIGLSWRNEPSPRTPPMGRWCLDGRVVRRRCGGWRGRENLFSPAHWYWPVT